MNKNTFAILCYKDHIWSKILISNLLNKKLIPLCVIEEESKFSLKKKIFYDRLISTTSFNNPYQSISIEKIINNYNKKNNTKVLHHIISSHNNDKNIFDARKALWKKEVRDNNGLHPEIGETTIGHF